MEKEKQTIMKLKPGDLLGTAGRQVLTGRGPQSNGGSGAVCCFSTLRPGGLSKAGASCGCLCSLRLSKPLSLDESKSEEIVQNIYENIGFGTEHSIRGLDICIPCCG